METTEIFNDKRDELKYDDPNFSWDQVDEGETIINEDNPNPNFN
jgi:hypothetical protein